MGLLVVGHGLCLTWGLPSKWDWALDSVDGQTILATYNHRLRDGWTPEYPPLHARLVTLVWWPIRYLQFGPGPLPPAQEQAALSSATLTGRVVSLAMLLGLLVGLRRLGRLVWNDVAGVSAAWVVGLSVPFAYYGHTGNREVPYLFWDVWGLLFLVRAVRDGRHRDFALLSVCLALSLATKDQAAGFLPFTGLWLVARLAALRHQAGQRRWLALVDSRLWLAVAVGAVIFCANWELPWRQEAFGRHLAALFGSSFEGYKLFEDTLGGRLRLLMEVVVLCLDAMGWPTFLLALAGTALVIVEKRRQPGPAALWVPTASYVVCFLLIVMVVWVRWVMPLVIVLGLMAGRVMAALPAAWPRLKPLWGAVMTAALVYQVWYGGSVWVATFTDTRYRAEDWLEAHVPAGGVVLTYCGPGYLPRFYGDFDVRFFAPVVEHLRANQPDYIVLSELGDPLPGDGTGGEELPTFYRDLFAGRLGYTVHQDFRLSSAWWPAHRLTQPVVSPRIVILKRIKPAVRVDSE